MMSVHDTVDVHVLHGKGRFIPATPQRTIMRTVKAEDHRKKQCGATDTVDAHVRVTTGEACGRG